MVMNKKEKKAFLARMAKGRKAAQRSSGHRTRKKSATMNGAANVRARLEHLENELNLLKQAQVFHGGAVTKDIKSVQKQIQREKDIGDW